MTKNKLYNSKQKMQFLNDKFQHDNHSFNAILVMFEQLSDDEYTANTDLCDMNPKQIALLLSKHARYNKFTSFRSRYSLLLLYREYCIENNLINAIKFYGNIKRFGEQVNDQELYDIFDQHRKSYRKYFYHPKDLYEFLYYQVYDIREVQFVPDGTVNEVGFTNGYFQRTLPNNVISADELVVLYLCLLYYGVPKDQCCNIKISDISIDHQKESIIICLNHEYFAIDMFLAPLLERVMSAKYICRNRNLTQTFIPKDTDYLLCYAEDDTPEERTKRNKRLSDKYYKDAERQGEAVISVKEIIDQGTIYRMCVLSYDQHFHPKTMQDHIDLYKAVGGTGTMNIKSSRPTELRRTYTEHFNELYINYD